MAEPLDATPHATSHLTPATAPIETDALIVGAGPVGLFQVFELGLLEIGAHVVDALPLAGGQCLELYADKPIYDIPALPYCTGRELVERLQKQIAPFAAGFHLGQQVSEVTTRPDGRDDVDAADAQLARLIVARSEGRIGFVAGQASAFTEHAERLTGLIVDCNDGSAQTLPLDLLWVRLGWSPKLGPIADWGIALDRKQVVVDTHRFETSTRGIFAVGDINLYPGKRKLIVSGFHEATPVSYTHL